jgi:hypothetical protein
MADMPLDQPASPAVDPGMMTGMMSGPTYAPPPSQSITGTDRAVPPNGRKKKLTPPPMAQRYSPKMPTHQKRYASGSVKPKSSKRK